MFKHRHLRSCVLALFIIFSLAATGCDHYHKKDGSSAGAEELNHDGHGAVTSEGGTVEVTGMDPLLDINGAKVVVPEGAVEEGEQVFVYIDHEDQLPGAIEDNTTAGSKVFVLSKSTNDKFLLPVLVTIPYTDANMEEGDLPLVFYWDEESGKYVSVGIKSIDTVNKTVTFSTVHFSKYVVLFVRGIDAILGNPGASFYTTTGLTGFQPDVDGFFHPNFGSYDSPGGSSMGIASFSEWFYQMKKTSDGNGLYSKYREGNVDRWEDDVTARELISRAYMDASRIWGTIWAEQGYFLDDKLTGKLLILAMRITHTPQTLIMNGTNFSHAVSVYDYNPSTGIFSVYDSNFPGETVTLKWDRSSGAFSNYTKAAAYPEITRYVFEAYSTLFASKELNDLYDGAQSGWSSSKFQTISISTPTLNANNTAIVNDPDNITISGTVTGGLHTATYLVYNVNGTDGLAGQLIPLGTDGSFSFTIANLPLATNSIMLMATDSERDARRRVPGSYAGFEEIIIKIQGQNFFTNLGFETGDFASWYHETHTWNYYGTETAEGSFTPEKSGIVTNGKDPIFTTLEKVYTGNYSARVNNEDNYYHVSSVKQSAVVPNVVNPELRFYWAAVLEDPMHPSYQQPYVDIVVTDDTDGGAILYNKHFYTNDPSYSGWQTVTPAGYYEPWRVITWQTVIIPCNAVKGHQITLKVKAADCAQGGHGGYVYLDGEE